jgi:hypothetical protein
MSNTMRPIVVSVLAGIVVALAGVGAYVQSSLGGPGTAAFTVRVLLVALAVAGALLLGLALRTQLAAAAVSHPTSRPQPNRER